ncbi:MAG: SAM-dependent chlorinase/fluorinase [Gemmatimonadaceae bacterium]|jgi:S-adenosyl-L-methionine hydrolase (adenosine-forming)|nr:SAM-dependent chlorinase/fluorinase [Gemmatimonadaceae bacterium]
MSRSPITLLTDFGTADGYVAELKGVLSTLAPTVPLLDLSHDIPPQDITAARLALARCWRRFPVGTVHLVVVDPGVGTSRAALAVASEGRFLVGPDNGVLSPALFALDAQVVQLVVPDSASATFHGRDVFAPAAARLATGAPLDELGERLLHPVRLRTPAPRRDADGALHGEVLTIDRFGNAITNLMPAPGALPQAVVAGQHALRVVRTYAEAEDGEAVALVGSSGWLELAVRNGNAAATLGFRRGDAVKTR